MAEQRARHDWRLFSALMCVIHNRTRFSDRDKAASPTDYDPYAKTVADIPLSGKDFARMMQGRYGKGAGRSGAVVQRQGNQAGGVGNKA